MALGAETRHDGKTPASTSAYRLGSGLARWLSILTLVLAAFMSLYPLVLMIINSFKSDSEMYVNPAGLPAEWTLASYAQIFVHHDGLWRNFVNSIVISLIATVLAVAVSAMAAFAFSKYRFRGRDLIFSMLLATMMVPPEIVMPGQYLMMAKLHWLNTLQVQILPGVTSVLGLFFMRQYMLTVPDEILEAARMDGASDFALFWRIMLPASAPVLMAFAILHFMGTWNAYTWPVLVATQPAIQPLVVALPQLRDPVVGFLPVWGTIMAGCVLSTIPILAVFVAFQDEFMSSAVIGAVKG